MIQLLLHLFGDYIIQNDNVGLRKKEKSTTGLLYCIFHCITYSLVFLLITNIYGIILIGLGHFIIDRWNIVGHFIAKKNFVNNTDNFGYKKERPFAVTVWLYIIQDNAIHLIWNYIVITYLFKT